MCEIYIDIDIYKDKECEDIIASRQTNNNTSKDRENRWSRNRCWWVIGRLVNIPLD